MEALLISDSTVKTAAEYAIDTVQKPRCQVLLQRHSEKFSPPPGPTKSNRCSPRLNDYSATVIGLIRDGGDFRQILHGNIIYRGDPGLGIAAYSNSNNNHYEDLEDLGPTLGNLADPNILEGTINPIGHHPELGYRSDQRAPPLA